MSGANERPSCSLCPDCLARRAAALPDLPTDKRSLLAFLIRMLDRVPWEWEEDHDLDIGAIWDHKPSGIRLVRTRISGWARLDRPVFVPFGDKDAESLNAALKRWAARKAGIAVATAFMADEEAPAPRPTIHEHAEDLLKRIVAELEVGDQ